MSKRFKYYSKEESCQGFDLMETLRAHREENVTEFMTSMGSYAQRYYHWASGHSKIPDELFLLLFTDSELESAGLDHLPTVRQRLAELRGDF